MAQADAAVVRDSELAPKLSHTFMKSENSKAVRLVDFTGDANVSRVPDYHIFIYNIAPRKFEIRRPPYFPCVSLAACPSGQPYVKVATVPNVVNEKWIDADTGETRVRGIIGERFVMDLLNPSNLGVDMWRDISDEQMSWIDGGTDDLTRRGLFFSTDDPPKQEHIEITRRRMEEHYKRLIQQADEINMQNIPDLKRTIGMEHHLAAEYFHAKSPWHIVAELPSTCVNCGELIKKDVAFHRNELGFICVIDWKRAVAAGAKTKADVPEGLQWWKEK